MFTSVSGLRVPSGGHLGLGLEIKSSLLCIRSTRLFTVNAIGLARKVPGKHAEICHHALLPEEGVKGFIAGQVRLTDDLASVIDVYRAITSRASKVAEVLLKPLGRSPRCLHVAAVRVDDFSREPSCIIRGKK